MAIIVSYQKKEKAKVKAVGDVLGLSTLFVIIGKTLAEKVSVDKDISMEEAEKFVVESIADGIKIDTK